MKTLAQKGETEIKSLAALQKEIEQEIAKIELPYTEIFLKFQKEAKNKKYSSISAQEFTQLLSILKNTLHNLSKKGLINQEDLSYLTQLIDTESLKQEHSTGSAILALTLKLNKVKI